MAIQKRPITPDSFISGAPDAPAPPSPPTRKNKVQIAVTIAPDLLATIDALAARKGLSRAAAISLACAELVERDARN